MQNKIQITLGDITSPEIFHFTSKLMQPYVRKEIKYKSLARVILDIVELSDPQENQDTRQIHGAYTISQNGSVPSHSIFNVEKNNYPYSLLNTFATNPTYNLMDYSILKKNHTIEDVANDIVSALVKTENYQMLKILDEKSVNYNLNDSKTVFDFLRSFNSENFHTIIGNKFLYDNISDEILKNKNLLPFSSEILQLLGITSDESSGKRFIGCSECDLNELYLIQPCPTYYGYFHLGCDVIIEPDYETKKLKKGWIASEIFGLEFSEKLEVLKLQF